MSCVNAHAFLYKDTLPIYLWILIFSVYARSRVVSALSRFGPSFRPGSFRPGSFRPNLVGRFGLFFFSKSPWVRKDRLKKNVMRERVNRVG